MLACLFFLLINNICYPNVPAYSHPPIFISLVTTVSVFLLSRRSPSPQHHLGVCACVACVCVCCVCVCVCVCVCSVHARTSPVPYGSLRMNDPPSLCPVNTHHHTFRYDASGMADGTAHPITNNRGSVTCPASGVGADFSYEGPQSCAMKPVVGDSGDSTAGCPKVFTYAPTEFLG